MLAASALLLARVWVANNAAVNIDHDESIIKSPAGIPAQTPSGTQTRAPAGTTYSTPSGTASGAPAGISAGAPACVSGAPGGIAPAVLYSKEGSPTPRVPRAWKEAERMASFIRQGLSFVEVAKYYPRELQPCFLHLATLAVAAPGERTLASYNKYTDSPNLEMAYFTHPPSLLLGLAGLESPMAGISVW